MLQFIWYPKCSTCRRVKALLDENGVQYTLRDIVEQPPAAEELRAWAAQSGKPLKQFFNTSGLQYKALHLAQRLPGMTAEQQLVALAGSGMLVKRPLLVGGGEVLVGPRAVEGKYGAGRARGSADVAK